MAILHGKIVDPNGKPVAEATVYFISAPVAMPDVAQLTDTNGQITMSVGVAGKYVIGASADEWGSGQTSIEIGEDETLEISVRLNQPKERSET